MNLRPSSGLNLNRRYIGVLKMLVQVLAIGETQSGISKGTGNPWNRRTFQVFVPEFQVAGNIQVFGDLAELHSYKEGGKYEAKTEARPGNNGQISIAITKMTPMKNNP